MSSTDSARYYSIESAASPQQIKAVLETYYWGNPTATGDRDQRFFSWFGVETTATAGPGGTTGKELRIRPAISGSLMIIMDAILDVTLGTADTATIYYESDQPIIWGALNQMYQRNIGQTPGQEAGRYKERRMEAAAMWNALSAKYMPLVDFRIMFDDDPNSKLKNSPGF